MDYNNNQYGTTTTSYGAQGGATGGGFLPNSQNPTTTTTDSPSNGKRSYGKDTLRPVTIRQLLNAHHPHPDAEYFVIDGAETTQITFVGQVRNISAQTTNVTYKLDDGTGSIEVKVWVDSEAEEQKAGVGGVKVVVEQGYARAWGRLKVFGSKRHVGANIIRPVTDFNEIAYHLLEATAVHLHYTRGPASELGSAAKGGAPQQQQATSTNNYNGGSGGGNGGGLPQSASMAARRVYQTIKDTPQTNEGLHMQDIATRAGMELNEVMKGGDELQSMGLIYTTVDDHTWAVLDV